MDFIAKLAKQYEGFVLKNLDTVSMSENLLRAGLYFLPSSAGQDIAKQELNTELVYAAVGSFSLLNDLVVLSHCRQRLIQHNNNSNNKNNNSNNNDDDDSSVSNILPPIKYTKGIVLLALIRLFELSGEMYARIHYGNKTKWKVILYIEILKAIIKLVILAICKGNLITHSTLPARDAMQAEVKSLDKSPPKMKGKSTTKSRQTLITKAYEEGNIMVTGRGLPSMTLRQSKVTNSKTAGEILYIIRPIVHVLAMFQFGKKAWTPWLLSLAVDIASRNLSFRDSTLTGVELNEMNTRLTKFAFYMARTPCYESITGTINSVTPSFISSMRLIKFLSGIIENYRKHHFYTTGS